MALVIVTALSRRSGTAGRAHVKRHLPYFTSLFFLVIGTNTGRPLSLDKPSQPTKAQFLFDSRRTVSASLYKNAAGRLWMRA